jgi:hypothetical protein
MDINQRLRAAREAAGFKSMADAAKAVGVPYPTYAGHENGGRGAFRRDEAGKYSRAFKVSLEWLLTGKGPMRRTGLMPVLGYVGAGAEVYPIDDHAQGAALDTVETGVPEGAVALVIRGDSQHPLQDGWLIVYRRENDGVADSCLGRLCVTKVHDGPTLLKTVRKGKSAKTFDLESWNAPLREGVRLDWATPVLMIRPK